MIPIFDRIPTKAGRVKITREDTGEVMYAVLTRDDEPTEEGTKLDSTLFNSISDSIGAKAPVRHLSPYSTYDDTRYPYDPHHVLLAPYNNTSIGTASLSAESMASFASEAKKDWQLYKVHREIWGGIEFKIGTFSTFEQTLEFEPPTGFVFDDVEPILDITVQGNVGFLANKKATVRVSDWGFRTNGSCYIDFQITIIHPIDDGKDILTSSLDIDASFIIRRA